MSLPPANEVLGKVIFLHLFVILFKGGRTWLRGGACVAAGGCAWLWGGGGHAWLQGGVRGCGGMCGGGHAWSHGVHGCRGHAWLWGVVCGGGGVVAGACMVVGGHAWLQGCVCGCGGCVWLWGGMHRIRRDTVNMRAVCILLECILVSNVVNHFINVFINVVNNVVNMRNYVSDQISVKTEESSKFTLKFADSVAAGTTFEEIRWYKGSRSNSIVYFEETAHGGKPKYFHDYCASNCDSSNKVSLDTQTGDLTIMEVGLRDEDYYYYKFSVSGNFEAGEKYEIKMEVSCKFFFLKIVSI